MVRSDREDGIKIRNNRVWYDLIGRMVLKIGTIEYVYGAIHLFIIRCIQVYGYSMRFYITGPMRPVQLHVTRTIISDVFLPVGSGDISQ